MTDHKHQWITPLKRGVPTGEPTRCRICKAAPAPLRCVNCGKIVDESVGSHGSLGGNVHSIRISTNTTKAPNTQR